MHPHKRCAFVYFAVQCCIESIGTASLFQAQGVLKQKCESSGDVTGTAKKHQLCIVLPYFSRYCTVRLKMFSLSFVMTFYVLFM